MSVDEAYLDMSHRFADEEQDDACARHWIWVGK